MADLAEQRESEILRLLANRFESEGYVFLVHPSESLLPWFLKDYRPDAIALSPKGSDRASVVIEVKAGGRPESSKQLSEIARRVESQPNWKFQVYYSGAFPSQGAYGRPNRAEVSSLVDEVKSLEQAGFMRAAFAAGWAALEASARALRSESSEVQRAMSPQEVIEWLASAGRLNSADARSLRSLARLRNEVVHGVPNVAVQARDVLQLRKALDQVIARFDQPN